MIIVDSHCHLNHEKMDDNTVEDLIQRAEAADVKYMQTICTKVSEFKEIKTIAEKYPQVFCSFGIHPHEAGEDVLTVEEIVAYASSSSKVIGIGETGLDYYYDNAPRDLQKQSFRRHIQAARQLDLPVIIHTRDAEDDTIEIMEEAFDEGPVKFLFHCFSSSPKMAAYAVEKGVYVSASGIITFNSAKEVRDGFDLVPNDLLLVETDAPYLAPTPHRGKTNEPAYTRNVLEYLANMKGVTSSQMAEITTQNFQKLFSKAVL